MGGLALLIFLISDLRVAGATGTLSESCGRLPLGAEAIPQGGFYLELAGSVALTISGIALATLTPQQLGALRPPRRSRSERAPLGDADAMSPRRTADERKGRLSRLGRRPRARQRS